jgi:VIT1/CCC1 family predicted Fe2+/Mn2+ transporter
MNLRRRVLTNLIIIAAAAAISYGIGHLAKALWGIPA